MANEPESSSEVERLRATIRQLEAQVLEHKRTAQELTASTAKTNAILDVAVDGILTIDESGTIESVNAAVGRMFGYKPHELIGQNVKLLMPSPFDREHDGYLERYRRTGQRRIIGIGRELRGLRRGGGIFPLELAVSEGFDGERRFFTGMVRDLSDRDEARRAQASLAAILEESLNEIFVFSAESLRFLQVNRGARENLGYTIAELRDLTPVDIKPEFSTEEFLQRIAPLRDGEVSRLHFETVHARKDGSQYPASVHLQRGSYGGEPAFVALIFDLTERDQVLETLERTEQRAIDAEQLASIATLTAGIAHDIGTPMNIILGYAQMLQRSVEQPKDRARVDVIVDQVNRITDLVRTLLNMARPQDEKLGLIEIGSVIEHSLAFFQEKLKKHDITVERDLGSVGVIEGDPDRLEQVFLNLFVNAVDAMPEGGTLRVSTVAREGWVEVVVSDSGTGIPADLQEQIFEPFVTTKERGRGTGLGLVVAKAIVLDHGGEISLESSPENGTAFHLRFPEVETKQPN